MFAPLKLITSQLLRNTILWLTLACPALLLASPLKPRIVVLTDISPATVEPDDLESMVRLLVCADLVEIEALVATTGWSIGGGEEHPELIFQAIDAYEKDLPNLMKRSAQTGAISDESRQTVGYWPSPAYLRSVTMLGSRKRGMNFIGKDNHSPGSDLILRLAYEPDERPIWVLGWGGGNTLAQAIWRVQSERSSEQLGAFLRRLRFYSITDQDRGYEKGTPFEISSHQWMRREFAKDLFFIWDEGAWMFQNGTGKLRWQDYEEHIQNHGNLGAMYPKYRFGVEGDTPSLLYVLPNGLNEPEHPEFGGWGGCYMRGTGPDGKTEAWVNQRGLPSHESSRKHFERFYSATFNSFAARMDWAAKGAGNREPSVIINGDTGLASVNLTPAAGTSIVLDASQSRDPDGDVLRFSWSVLPGVGDDSDAVALSDSDSSKATLFLPANSAGKRFHVVCEVTDSGTPSLTGYRRIILEPKPTTTQIPPAEKATVRPRVVVLSDFPPLDTIPVGAGHGPAEKRSDPDDLQSMVRFLLYGNEFDIEGLVASSATLANVARKQNIHAILDVYDQVDENLRMHDPKFPTADRLRSITWQGRDNTWGKPADALIGEGKDSEASEAIIRLVDAPDPRPIWFCVWGGPADLAQAIWKVRATRSASDLDRFLSKLRVYLIIKQDGTAQWLMDQFPKLFIILTERNYFGMFWNAQGSENKLADLDWVQSNVRNSRGPLGAVYPESGANPSTPGVIEGDSPSFLHLASAVRGINDPEKPEQPGWGGQFVRREPDKNHWFDHPSGGKSVWKWRAEFQEDFATRMKWCLPRVSVARPTELPAQEKQRVIVLTDIENEPDDAMSMVRFLVYSNQWDVEGLVATTSVHQKKKVAAWRIREIVEAYGKVRDNLEKHEPGFPTVENLLAVTCEGRADYGMYAVGEGMDSAGSELIIKAVDQEDPRPLWVPVWGGPNCLAQALWKVQKTRPPEAVDRFVAKLRVYTISDQDDSGPWLRKTFPKLFYITSPGMSMGGAYHFATWSGISGDRFHGRFVGADFAMVDNPWLDEHIRLKGPLGAQYPKFEYLMEGDTPSFLYLINNGLGVPEKPNWGSWGGRYELYTPPPHKRLLEPETRPLWTDADDELLGVDGHWHTSNQATIWRWRTAFQNDFSARMDWTIKPYAEANHPPVPKLDHAAELAAKPGERVFLSAKGSNDPDGNALGFEWTCYGEAGTFTTSVATSGAPILIENSTMAEASFIVPKKNIFHHGTIHIILAVTDQGSPPLTRYKRVIVTVD